MVSYPQIIMIVSMHVAICRWWSGKSGKWNGGKEEERERERGREGGRERLFILLTPSEVSRQVRLCVS